jgi:hypothetical protein
MKVVFDRNMAHFAAIAVPMAKNLTKLQPKTTRGKTMNEF